MVQQDFAPHRPARQVQRSGDGVRRVPYAADMSDAPDMISAAVEHHFQRLGPTTRVSLEGSVDQLELAVHVIEPTQERPCYTLFTTGMSHKAMCMPDDLTNPDDWNRAELMICLPQGWFGDHDLLRTLGSDPGEHMFWPIRLLKTLAQFPHEHASWVVYGQTFPNDDPPTSYAEDTGMAGCLALWPLTTPRDFRHCYTAGGMKIQVYSLVPLYLDELELDLEGPDGLLGLLDRHHVSEVLNPQRPSTVTGPNPG